MLKACTRCKQEKTLDLQNFPPHNRTKSGFDSWCRSCRATYRNGINRGKFRNVISDDALIKLKLEVFIMNGKKEGIYRKYYENGQLCEEVNYIDDKMNGIYKRYHENGQLWIEVNYIDNEKNGIYKSYYENGQLWLEVNYIDDKENGIYKLYYQDGKLFEEVNYIDGEIKKNICIIL